MSTSASSEDIEYPSSYAHLSPRNSHLALSCCTAHTQKQAAAILKLYLTLGYGACMRLGLRGIGATPSLAHCQPLGALVLPTIVTPIELVYARELLCDLNVSLTVSLACLPRSVAHRGTDLGNGTIRNRFRLCVSVAPRAGVAALVALMFRRTRARPAFLRWSHVWAQNP
jgi:hypothetical protein